MTLCKKLFELLKTFLISRQCYFKVIWTVKKPFSLADNGVKEEEEEAIDIEEFDKAFST